MLKIYKASAGSGKTYTLAYEYIRMLLGVKIPEIGRYRLNHPKYSYAVPYKHRAILAITFTNKATDEMKQRIIQELDSLTVLPLPGADDAEYAGRLCRELECGRQELAEAADKAMRELLYDYNSFNVLTIDSFFQRVMRTFARELDRQGDFAVELSEKVAVQKSVDTMLDDYNIDHTSNPDLGKWIFDFMLQQIEEGKKSNFFNRKSQVHNRLVDLVSKITNEKFKSFEPEMRRYLQIGENEHEGPSWKEKIEKIYTRIYKYIADVPEVLKVKAQATLAALDADGVNLDQMDQRSAVVKMMNDMATGEKIELKRFALKGVSDFINEVKTPWTKRFKGNEGHTQALIDLIKEARSMYQRCSDYAVVRLGLHQLMLLGYAWQYLDRFITENNTVLITDTNHLLKQIINDDDTPFIYERLGMALSNFLIDEFQDTSRMQWENLRPLVANGLSNSQDSLIIGDEKQSIYRFRNADASLLHSKVANEDFPAPRHDTRIFGAAKGENTNYRSAADIVRFNNTLFTELAHIYKVEGYENAVQDISDKHRGDSAFIHFVPIDEDTTDDAADDAEKAPANQYDIMAQNILRQHEECGYAWSDIAIIVVKNSIGTAAVQHLVNHYPDIPIVSDEALLLKKSPAVQMIVGILELFAQDSAPKPRISDDGNRYPNSAELTEIVSRYKYFINKGYNEYSAIDQAIQVQAENTDGEALASGIANIRQRKPSTLVALVETIIHLQLSDDERRSQMAYITAFQDYVIDYCSRYNPSVRALLSAWQVQSAKLAVMSGGDVDAVRVMTIHKSKGLEFPCVHIPEGAWSETLKEFTEWIAFPADDNLKGLDLPPAIFADIPKSASEKPYSMFYKDSSQFLAEAMTDNLNKTYVAYTRAGRELIVYYKPAAANLGGKLTEAFKSSLPMPDDRLMNLSEYYNPDTKEFLFGEPTKKEDTDKEKAPSSTSTRKLNQYDVYFHEGAEMLTRVADMLDLDPDIEDEMPNDEEEVYIDDDSRLRGITLHDILSMIFNMSDIDHAVKHTCNMRRLDPDQAEAVRGIVDRMLETSDERIVRWFGNYERVLTEQTIYGEKPKPFGKNPSHERRLDRLVVNHDGSVDIIDYKFTSERKAVHRLQVLDYIDLLHEMGYENVRGYLWYPFIDERQIIEVK